LKSGNQPFLIRIQPGTPYMAEPAARRVVEQAAAYVRQRLIESGCIADAGGRSSPH